MSKWIKTFTIKTASKSRYPRFRHGAVLVSGGRIVASGCNMLKARTPNSSMSTHSEMVPLKRVISYATRSGKHAKYDIYVARMNNNNEPCLSKPCAKCMSTLIRSGLIATIHFTTDDGWGRIRV
jgi:deoxycytidylate deaminase